MDMPSHLSSNATPAQERAVADPAYSARCGETAAQLHARYQWTLLAPDELAELALQAAHGSETPAELETLVKRCYTLALYATCRQRADPERRERGYADLQRYLYRAAYNRRPDLAEDATQRALLLVFEQIERCHDPGAFLTFALFKLLHALQQEQSARRGGDLPEAPLAETRDPEPSPVDKLVTRECLEILAAALRRLPAERQRQVVALKFFAGLSDEEIGARLRMSAGNVRVLRHRSLARLREDAELQRCNSSDGG